MIWQDGFHLGIEVPNYTQTSWCNQVIPSKAGILENNIVFYFIHWVSLDHRKGQCYPLWIALQNSVSEISHLAVLECNVLHFGLGKNITIICYIKFISLSTYLSLYIYIYTHTRHICVCVSPEELDKSGYFNSPSYKKEEEIKSDLPDAIIIISSIKEVLALPYTYLISGEDSNNSMLDLTELTWEHLFVWLRIKINSIYELIINYKMTLIYWLVRSVCPKHSGRLQCKWFDVVFKHQVRKWTLWVVILP